MGYVFHFYSFALWLRISEVWFIQCTPPWMSSLLYFLSKSYPTWKAADMPLHPQSLFWPPQWKVNPWTSPSLLTDPSAHFSNSSPLAVFVVQSPNHVRLFADTIWTHGLPHAKLPCPSLSPRVCPNSGPLSRWCYLTISSSATFFSFCPQSLPASESFPMSPLFASRGPSIGASASASVLPMNVQGWSPLGLTGFDLFVVQGTLKGLLQQHKLKALIHWSSTFFMFQLSCPYMTTGKTIALTMQTFVGKLLPLTKLEMPGGQRCMAQKLLRIGVQILKLYSRSLLRHIFWRRCSLVQVCLFHTHPL